MYFMVMLATNGTKAEGQIVDTVSFRMTQSLL